METPTSYLKKAQSIPLCIELKMNLMCTICDVKKEIISNGTFLFQYNKKTEKKNQIKI